MSTCGLSTCTPGIIFAVLSGLSVISSAFVSWSAFIKTLLIQAVLLWGAVWLCKGCHTTTLWWILAIMIGLPIFLIVGVLALGISQCNKETE